MSNSFPVSFRLDEEACNVIFANQFQNFSWGYLVYPLQNSAVPAPCDHPAPCGERYIRPTDDRRIVKFVETGEYGAPNRAVQPTPKDGPAGRPRSATPGDAVTNKAEW